MRISPGLVPAYAHCQRLARAHYENFPVASLLLPAHMRPHVAAIYAFARRADDAADEPGLEESERLRLLDGWEARLRLATGTRHERPVRGEHEDSDDLIFAALGETIRRCALPPELLTDLLSAFRQDVTTRRYRSWSDVLDYCRRSANPVGRLVLRIAGYRDPRLDTASDAVCTALQLTNFWQDLARDWAGGRLYVPQDDLARAGAQESDLEKRRMTSAWRSVFEELVARTDRLFEDGRAVCDGVHGRLRWELRLTWLGGTRVLRKVDRVRRDSFDVRPTLDVRDLPGLLRDAIFWKTTGRTATPAPMPG